jgi:hypothetical protein
MKKIIIVFSLFLILKGTVYTQVVKNIIVEHFTNTKCSICATRNPGLNNNFNLHPQVLHISIHPSSPYPACFLSKQNMADNDARTNYYGVYGGTPRIVINGNVITSATDYSDTALFAGYAGLSPFTIDVKQYAFGADSLLSRITIHRISEGLPVGKAILFAGLVEDSVFRNGGNGELKHYNVFRSSFFTPTGMPVELPSDTGDSAVFTMVKKYSAYWSPIHIATVAILQDSAGKEVIQSEMSTTEKINLSPGIGDKPGCTNDFHFFPNPAENVIVLENFNNTKLTFQIMNLNGKIVKRNTIQSNRIDVSDLPNGIYLLKVRDTDLSKSRKVVIRH